MVYYTEIGIEIDWEAIVKDVVDKYKEDKSSVEIIEEMKEYENEYFGKE